MIRSMWDKLAPPLALALVMITIAGGVYMRARYHSFNWFAAPPRIDVAGRSYEGPDPFTREQLLEGTHLPDGRPRSDNEFTRIGWLPPVHSIYAFGPEGQLKMRVYLEWGDTFYEYGILGGP